MSADATPREIAVGQRQGARTRQEDYVKVLRLADNRELGLALLADGMGGHAGGDVASRICVDAATASLETSGETSMPLRLAKAVRAADAAVSEAADADPNLAGMGSTLVVAAIEDGALYWASVGDSPLWLFRSGTLTRLNQDHSFGAVLDQMASEGRLSAEEARSDPRRSQLHSAIGAGVLRRIDISNDPFPLQAGDMLLLASDGVESLSPVEIAGLLEGREPQAAADAILQAIDALDLPHQDNSSLIVWSPTMNPKPRKSVRAGLNWLGIAQFTAAALAVLLFIVAAVGLLWGLGLGPTWRGNPFFVVSSPTSTTPRPPDAASGGQTTPSAPKKTDSDQREP